MDSAKAGSLVAWAQAVSSLARMSAGVPLGATIPRSTANTTLIPSSLSVGMLGISGFRFSVAIAKNLSWPASTLPLWGGLPQVGVQPGREPLVGDVLELDLSLLLDEGGEEVAGGAERGPHRDLPGPGLEVVEELLPRRPLGLRAGREDRRRGRDEADRLEGGGGRGGEAPAGGG